jgi:DNA gyrase/topoisomerase IV subunit A
MRGLLCILTAVTIATSAQADEYFPTDRAKPLFRLFAPIAMPTSAGGARPQFTFDDEHPLLVVYSVSDLMLARDNKGVLITLTPEDAKRFAEITRKYNDALLLLEANGQILQAMHITAPITDGIIGWKYPQEEQVAKYLRRRFHIAEFK